MKRYHIGYSFKDTSGFGFGSTGLRTNKKLTYEDLDGVINNVVEQSEGVKKEDVIILSIYRFE